MRLPGGKKRLSENFTYVLNEWSPNSILEVDKWAKWMSLRYSLTSYDCPAKVHVGSYALCFNSMRAWKAPCKSVKFQIGNIFFLDNPDKFPKFLAKNWSEISFSWNLICISQKFYFKPPIILEAEVSCEIIFYRLALWPELIICKYKTFIWRYNGT